MKIAMIRTRINGKTRYTIEDNLKGIDFYSKKRGISLSEAVKRTSEARNKPAVLNYGNLINGAPTR